MANISWIVSGTSSGLWGTSTHWSGGTVPTSADDVTLGTTAAGNNLGSYTVTLSSGSSFAANSLTMSRTATNNTTTALIVQSTGTLAIGTGGLTMGYGTTIDISGTVSDAGTLGLATGTQVNRAAPQINLTGGTFNLSDAFPSSLISLTTNIATSVIGFDFAGGNGTLDLGGPGASIAGTYTVSNAITNFGAGDKIDLTGAGSLVSFTLSGSNSISIVTLLGGSILHTYTFNNITTTGGTLQAISDGGSGVEIVVCYQAGTHILTPHGEVAVEDLREGDLVTTFSGGGAIHKPVTWIGQMRQSLDGHPEVGKVAPVRIRAGAVAENVPHRDLLVSPDHAICLYGALIPAKELVNGVSITQELDFEEVHYFHIELEQHDILLAEGLTAESYLDTGNRDAFAQFRAAPAMAREEERRIR